MIMICQGDKSLFMINMFTKNGQLKDKNVLLKYLKIIEKKEFILIECIFSVQIK